MFRVKILLLTIISPFPNVMQPNMYSSKTSFKWYTVLFTQTAVTSVTSSLSGPLSSLRGPMISVTPDSAEVDLRTNVESALSKEVGLVLLNLMDIFGTSFRVSPFVSIK